MSGVDLVDGTPILDIKPYIPSYDAPFGGARVGNGVGGGAGVGGGTHLKVLYIVSAPPPTAGAAYISKSSL